MKRFLSLILTLMLVFTIGTSVVMADEYVEALIEDAELNGTSVEELAEMLAMYGFTLDTEAMQLKDSETGAVLTEEEVNTRMAEMMGGGTETSSGSSEEDAYPGYDESSVVEYIEYDFSDMENIKYSAYITGTDGTLAYYKDMFYYNYGMQVEETDYDGKKALSVGTETLSADKLGAAGLVYVEEKGFFADKQYFSVPVIDPSNNGYEDGKLAQVIIFKFKDSSLNVTNAELKDGVVTKNVVAGNSESFMVTKTEINWVNVLIVVMCFVVFVLIVVTVIVAVLSKKKANKQNSLNDSKYVSEDEVFDELVEEAGIEVYEDEEVEEIEEDDSPEIEVIEKEDIAEESEEEDK